MFNHNSINNWLLIIIVAVFILFPFGAQGATGTKIAPSSAHHPSILAQGATGTKIAPSSSLTLIAKPEFSQEMAQYRQKAIIRKWGGRYIYMIMTDRWKNGDLTNDFLVEKDNPLGYHGGDFKGLIKTIPYLKSIGAGAIWITPVYDNRDSDFFDSYGYHGYWPIDFFSVDQHLGDIKDLQELVEKCHENDILVLLDIVVNHTSWDAFPDKKDWFHQNKDIEDWEDQQQLENRSLFGMPDFDQDNPQVYDFLLKMTRWWIEKTNCDGIRLDAVKHVPQRFWFKYLQELKEKLAETKPDFLFLGEVLHGNAYYMADYHRTGFDTLFDFPTYYPLIRIFGKDDSFHSLAAELKRDNIYPDPHLLVTLLDNHDHSRFASFCADNPERRLVQALAFLFTMRGMPCLLYGTEIPLYGQNETQARGDMIFEPRPKYGDYLDQLAQMRKNAPSLYQGIQLELLCQDQAYAFLRLAENDETICIFNNSPEFLKVDIALDYPTAIKGGIITDIDGRIFGIKNQHLIGQIPPYSHSIIRKWGFPKGRKALLREVRQKYSDWLPGEPLEYTSLRLNYDGQVPAHTIPLIVGSHPILGNWQPEKAPKMVEVSESGKGDNNKAMTSTAKNAIEKDGKDKKNWAIDLLFPVGLDLEYKMVFLDEKGEYHWQDGENKVLRIKN